VRRVGDRGEDGLARRGDVPLVDEHVGAHEPGDAQDEARQRLLDRQRRTRRVALVAELGHDLGAGERAREAEAVELPAAHRSATRSRKACVCRRGGPGRARGRPAPCRRVAGDARCRGDLHRVAGAEQVLAAVLDDLQRA
jgi:hypothetical protein